MCKHNHLYFMFLIVQTVIGDWAQWTPWSICDGQTVKLCKQGVRERERECVREQPETCSGFEFNDEPCDDILCQVVNGNWGPWTLYGQCSVTCGEGVQTRTRLCNAPAPVRGGESCDGVDTASKSCYTEHCAAFTATLPEGVHPYQNGGLIGYPIELLDTRGYSNGIFTVLPGMGGVYQVSVTMMSGSVTGHTTLRKNGAIVVWLFTNKEYDMASQTINIQLVEEDKIWVQMYNQPLSLFNVYNTFSAVRIR